MSLFESTLPDYLVPVRQPLGSPYAEDSALTAQGLVVAAAAATTAVEGGALVDMGRGEVGARHMRILAFWLL